MSMSKQIRVARSFVAASALADIISAEYDFGGPVACKLFSKMLRTQDNDHYLVTAPDGTKCVARVYQEGSGFGRQASDYQYELDWLLFLNEQNIPVSYPLSRKDGQVLGSVQAPEGKRYYALFSLAIGQPLSLHSEDQLFKMGQQMARIHMASNEFETDQHRQPLDLVELVDKPIARIKQFFADEETPDLDLLVIAAEEARAEIEELITNESESDDSWGPIGGDFHQASVFFNQANEPTFFNFDRCGPGWRSYDIASFLFNSNLVHSADEHLVEAFFAGYFSVRQLSENEHAAIAPFLTIRRIWHTGLFALSEGLAGHTFIAPI
jgi:Ser/Thr protein kinase RdoA (MazF antagonist)